MLTPLDPGLFHDPVLWTALLFLLGPCLGSFASAIIHRSRTGQSWIVNSSSAAARSQCPHCGGQLKWFDLVPVLSWLFLGGKCRMCKTPIGIFYPALEVVSLLLCLAILYFIGPNFTALIAVAAVPFLLTVLVLSWEGAPLPSDVIGVLLGLGLGLQIVHALNATEAAPVILDSLAGAFAFGIAGWLLASMRARLLKLRAAVSGEIPLLVTIGIWLGIGMLPVVLVAAGIYGFIVAILRILLRRPRQTGMTHAFAAAFVMTLLIGQRILELLIP